MFTENFYFTAIKMHACIKKVKDMFFLSIDTPAYSGRQSFTTREAALREMCRISNILLKRNEGNNNVSA